MHDGLVGLVLEITVPSRAEFWARPGVHLLQFIFSWPDLDTSVDAIGSQRTGT